MIKNIKQAFNKSNIEKVDPFIWLRDKVTEEKLRVILFGSPGNLGDMLIVAATIQKLESLKIPYEVGKEDYLKSLGRHDIFVIMGGGNYIPLYSSVKNLLEQLSENAPENQVVVLPSSSYGMNEQLSSLNSKVFFFCRELDTHKRLRSVLPEGQIFLSHDAALYLDMKDGRFRAMRNLRQVLKGRTVGTLYSMRGDVEKTDSFVIEEKHKNTDISSLRTNRGHSFLSKHTINTHAVFEDINFMFMYLLPFNLIVSNRLHVCIAGLLLGKKVVMYDNSYGKLSGVYNNSLLELYPGKVEINK